VERHRSRSKGTLVQVGELFDRVRTQVSLRLLIAGTVSTLFFLALVLPRSADSRFLPLPLPDHAAVARIDRAELARFALAAEAGGRPESIAAESARRSELSVGVRTVGELFRRAGKLVAANSPQARDAISELRRQFRVELELGRTKELLALRSLQSQLFVRALTGQSEHEHTELEELGGEFARLVEQGWLGGGSAGRSSAERGSAERGKVDEATLRLLFRVRWGHLLGCHREAPFGPSQDELRVYYRVYLLHPPRGDDEVSRALERVSYARALGQVDPQFPVDLAVGMLLLQAGERELALPPLRAHLDRVQGGPFANLARNHLLFAASEP